MIDLGPVTSDGFGLRPPTWAEIKAFGEATTALCEPWEYRALRSMCIAYLSGLRSGENPLSIPPMERLADG